MFCPKAIAENYTAPANLAKPNLVVGQYVRATVFWKSPVKFIKIYLSHCKPQKAAIAKPQNRFLRRDRHFVPQKVKGTNWRKTRGGSLKW
ncbi:MAG: hypothetical protein AB4290_18610 [Spirulina sp.]